MAEYVVPSGATGGNTAGNIHWKAPVADFASLPAEGNSYGDARITLDTGGIYVWKAGTPDAWFKESVGEIALDEGTILLGNSGDVAAQADLVNGDGGDENLVAITESEVLVKSLVAGSGVSLASDTDTVTISATGGGATYVPWYPFIASTAHAFSVAGSTPTARNSSLVVDRAGSYRPKLMVRVSDVTGSPTLVRVTANVALYAVKPDGTSRTLYAQNDEIAVHDNGSTYATNDFAVLTGGAISLNAGETIMQNGNSNPFRFLCNGSGTKVDAFSSAFYLEKQ